MEPITNKQELSNESLFQEGFLSGREQSRAQLLAEHLASLPIVRLALGRLTEELPKGLYYHSPEHSKVVFEEVIRLALEDKRSEHEIKLLAIAAAWHDTGFIAQSMHNEPIGAKFAAAAMQAEHYPREDILTVVTAILDTAVHPAPDGKALVQQKGGELSKYLLDADLSSFGSARFPDTCVRLFNETHKAKASVLEDLLRLEGGAAFLWRTFEMFKKHDWQTEPARRAYQAQKEKNLMLVKELAERGIQ